MKNKTMVVVAFIAFFLGVWRMADWIIFVTQPEIKDLNFKDVVAKYDAHLPRWILPLFEGRSYPITLICIVLFTGAGVVFILQKHIGFKILAIVSFILAFWQLFSLM